MGCDIHMFVEYRPKDFNKDYPEWRNFGNSFNPGRNYLMFGILSKGVRYNIDLGFPQKGIPENLGYYTLNESRYYICEDPGEDQKEVNLETALRWEKFGCKITNVREKPTFVEDPDMHSHSWLTLEEYRKAIEIYLNNSEAYNPIEYEAILASMERFESLGYDTRIVFWFDN
jgi:hypothetical protein